MLLLYAEMRCRCGQQADCIKNVICVPKHF